MDTFTLNFSSFVNSPKHICILPYIPCTMLNIAGGLLVVTGHPTDMPCSNVMHLAMETKTEREREREREVPYRHVARVTFRAFREIYFGPDTINFFVTSFSFSRYLAFLIPK